MKLAKEGAYDGTVFHRVIKHGIVQGGDPISKDPAKAKLYGTGGLGVLQDGAERGEATRGAVSAVLQPGRPDSAGAQFFVCVTDQPALDGKYTVFGRVSEGMDVLQKISEAPASPMASPAERHRDQVVAIRDTPPPEPVPFSADTPAQLAQYRAVLDTSAGPITIEFFGEKAPGARAELPPAGLGGRLRRHRVPSGGQGVCDPDRRAHEPRGADREAAGCWSTTSSPSSTTPSTSRASSRWRGATIRRAPPPRSSS